MILQDYLRKAIERLTKAGINQPALDVRLLVCAALGLERLDLILSGNRELTPQEETHIERSLTRREKREPIARILGQREFWGLPFFLNEATLEPRPDSETLIEAALHRTSKQPPHTLLDLGTGTGCLLLSLLHEWPKCQGVGTDIAARALDQAKENAKRLNLQNRVTFCQGSWFDGITGHFDMIISNPPYIPHKDIEGLEPDVRLYDPRAALDGGADGLDPYRIMTKALPSFLTKGGHVLFEVGIGQAQAVGSLLEQAGMVNLSVHKDLGGIDRIVAASL